MPSKTFAANLVLNAADVNLMNLDPQDQRIATDEATTSTSYVNLATVGPTVTVNLNAGQRVMLVVSCYGSNAGSNDHPDIAYMSYNVTGASGTTNAADAWGARLMSVKLPPLTSISTPTVTKASIYVATGTGSHQFQAKYRSLDSAISWHFIDRQLILYPKF